MPGCQAPGVRLQHSMKRSDCFLYLLALILAFSTTELAWADVNPGDTVTNTLRSE